ncbi:MAG: cardiolipin synthase [Defluviitaleaceae bacterium]|nr:cardiolipin synthase [Defluviitaleaceae bacterium]
MRKILTRMNITIFLLLLQITAIIFLAGWIVRSHVLFYYAGVFVSVLVFSFVLKKDEASVYKITWLIVILAFPPLGGIFYLVFGNKRPTKKIYAHMQEHALIAKILDRDGNLPVVSQAECGRMYGLLKYIRKESSYPAYVNTSAKYYSMGEPMFEDMLKEIAKARKFIFLETFIVRHGEMWDRLLAALEKKAAAGVEVRLIVDHLGSHKLFTREYLKELRGKNIHVLRFNPMLPILLMFMNNRDHRKILVVDGITAFTGGINIADEYINLKKPFGVWKDSGIRLKGDAAWSFTLMFIEMWDTFCGQDEVIKEHKVYLNHCSRATDGLIVPYGDTPLDGELLGENVYVDILSQAEKYVYIFTPYLIISEKLISALQLAAKRNVDVKIVTPAIPDKKLVFRLTRSYYRYLLEAGVRIYEYTPGFLHSKSVVCDDKIAVVGTINLDYRSLYLHFECAVLLYNSSAVADIKQDVLDTVAQSREVVQARERWRLGNELLDAVLHLFAPLM